MILTITILLTLLTIPSPKEPVPSVPLVLLVPSLPSPEPPAPELPGNTPCPRELLLRFPKHRLSRGRFLYDTVDIWKLSGSHDFFFTEGMAVDADGAPNAYDSADHNGLDFLANGGRPGNWWGIATRNGLPSGEPFIQRTGPYQGFYISQTSLRNPRLHDSIPAKYVDAATIPYIVLPPTLIGKNRGTMGDIAMVVNLRNGRRSAAIVADQGPLAAIGEGSIALALALGLPANLRENNAGSDGGILYIVFPGTGASPKWPRSLADITSKAEGAFKAWGGVERVDSCTGSRP